MWGAAFMVAMVAGLWGIILRLPVELFIISTGKDTKAGAWYITIMNGIADTLFYSPVVPAAITGLLLGDLRTGLLVGGTVQLMFIGVFIVGASVPPSPYLASVLATALAILTGAETGEALALVVPVAIFSQVAQLGLLSLNTPIVHWADRLAEKGNSKGIDFLNSINKTGWSITAFVPAFLAVGLGVDAAASLMNAIPGWLSGGLGYSGGILPALGFGMLLIIIASAEVWPFFFLGFLAAVYMDINALAGAVLGVVVGLVYVKLKSAATESTTAEPVATAVEKTAVEGKLSDSALYGAFWRTFNFAGNYNFERLMALGMAQVMVPVFRDLRLSLEEVKEGFKRHLVFYNTHPYFGSLIMGMMVAMEEAKARGEDVTDEAINGLKVAMMGPFAGVGDSLFWGTLHPIILAISANLAVEGSAMSLLVSLVGIGGLAVLGHYYPFFWGYRGGVNVIAQIQQSHILDKVTLGARIVAMVVAGVMGATLINISTPVVLFQTEAEGSGVALQGVLDQIMPKLLPLGLLFLVYWLLKKRLSPVWVMVVLMALSVAGTAFGLLG